MLGVVFQMVTDAERFAVVDAVEEVAFLESNAREGGHALLDIAHSSVRFAIRTTTNFNVNFDKLEPKDFFEKMTVVWIIISIFATAIKLMRIKLTAKYEILRQGKGT